MSDLPRRPAKTWRTAAASGRRPHPFRHRRRAAAWLPTPFDTPPNGQRQRKASGTASRRGAPDRWIIVAAAASALPPAHTRARIAAVRRQGGSRCRGCCGADGVVRPRPGLPTRPPHDARSAPSSGSHRSPGNGGTPLSRRRSGAGRALCPQTGRTALGSASRHAARWRKSFMVMCSSRLLTRARWMVRNSHLSRSPGPIISLSARCCPRSVNGQAFTGRGPGGADQRVAGSPASVDLGAQIARPAT